MAKMSPSLNIPESSSTVDISIIDTTSRIRLPSSSLFQPSIKGNETLDAPAYSFLIEHPANGRKLLFDLGLRKDWQNLAPAFSDMVKEGHGTVQIEKNVAEILVEGGVKLEDIEALIWR